MKRILLTTVVLITAVLNGMAQQQPVLSQYMLNRYYFNPAYTGSGELYNASFLHRTQWSGYKDYTGNTGAPETQILTATANLDSTGHGFGLLASRDKAASLTTFQVELSYAYSLALSSNSTLALGARVGIASRSIDYADYIIKHPNDVFIKDGKQSETKPNVTLGLWYTHEKYYVGLSAKGLVTQANYETLGLENEKAIIATAGYHFGIAPDWALTPSAQLITTTDRTAVQGAVMANHDDTLWAGLSYRHEEAASIIVGFAALEKKLRVSYAFDYTTGNRSTKGSTSHEIMVGYRIGKLHPKVRVPKITPAVTPPAAPTPELRH